MLRVRRAARAAVLAGSVVLATTMMVPPAAAHESPPPWKVIASGLDSPRHLEFSPSGDLYVVEAGRGGTGPCATNDVGTLCLGHTGGVTKVQEYGPDYRVLSGLPSIKAEPLTT